MIRAVPRLVHLGPVNDPYLWVKQLGAFVKSSGSVDEREDTGLRTLCSPIGNLCQTFTVALGNKTQQKSETQ